MQPFIFLTTFYAFVYGLSFKKKMGAEEILHQNLFLSLFSLLVAHLLTVVFHISNSHKKHLLIFKAQRKSLQSRPAVCVRKIEQKGLWKKQVFEAVVFFVTGLVTRELLKLLEMFPDVTAIPLNAFNCLSVAIPWFVSMMAMLWFVCPTVFVPTTPKCHVLIRTNVPRTETGKKNIYAEFKANKDNKNSEKDFLSKI